MTDRKRVPGGPGSPIARRARVVCGVSFGLFAGLSVRLAYVQMVRHEFFVKESYRYWGVPVEIEPHRGGLMDRNQTYLVHNEPAFLVTMDPNSWYGAPDPKAPVSTPEERKKYCLDALRSVVPEFEIDKILTARPIRRGKRRLITYDFRKVSVEVAERLRKKGAVGLSFTPTSRRVIVDGTIAPQIVGVTNRKGFGLEGLESSLNKKLAGKSGKIVAEFDGSRNNPSRVFRVVPLSVRSEVPVQQGIDYVLTLDAAIQKRAQAALTSACVKHHAEAGTAVVLNTQTGEILAMANWPSFDLAKFTEANPLARENQAVTLPYEPGSTLKAMTVAAALEEKLVLPDTYFHCTGSVRIGGKTIHCASHGGSTHGHGDETLSDVIRNSCNVATAACAIQLKPNRLTAYLKRFGFTRPTGAGLPGESGGQLSNFSTWSKVKLANVGFGQGVSVTSLQLAAAYGAFATGEYVPPQIVRGTIDPATGKLLPASRVAPRRVVSPETARTMREMLQAVVDRGTGRLARLSGYTAGGKTGTAQVAENGVYGKKYVASFVGLAPLRNPKIVALVAIRDPKGKEHFGGDVAAPAFREIAESALRELRVPPDRPEEPPTTLPLKAAPHTYAEL